ncbi:hypothetical protein cyc_03375 [Cyclospora cayetanensis]|uniref:Uncharacterized protein n=1 Tax=Cyclospora cayetanensis TaxID=88456 RepID=A0A1D3D9G5_9EIME|nr:hypothetical protein cyc_03375 [Cyclospora cayetanensis]
MTPEMSLRTVHARGNQAFARLPVSSKPPRLAARGLPSRSGRTHVSSSRLVVLSVDVAVNVRIAYRSDPVRVQSTIGPTPASPHPLRALNSR